MAMATVVAVLPEAAAMGVILLHIMAATMAAAMTAEAIVAVRGVQARVAVAAVVINPLALICGEC